MTRYLSMRSSERVEVERAFVEVLDEIELSVVKEITKCSRRRDEEIEDMRKSVGKDDKIDLSPFGTDDALNAVDEVFHDPRSILGLETLIDVLDRAGFVVARERPLTSRDRSVKTRKPRIRRLLEA